MAGNQQLRTGNNFDHAIACLRPDVAEFFLRIAGIGQRKCGPILPLTAGTNRRFTGSISRKRREIDAAVVITAVIGAEKEIGFVTSNYQLMIEALAASDGSFGLTVTRTKEEKKRLPKKLKTAAPKPKLLPLDKNIPTLVYKFNTFDDFYDLCNKKSSKKRCYSNPANRSKQSR